MAIATQMICRARIGNEAKTVINNDNFLPIENKLRFQLS